MHTSNTPPLVLIQRYEEASVNTFRCTMASRADIAQMLQTGENWYTHAVQEPINSPADEKQKFRKAMAIAARHHALFFQMGQHHQGETDQLQFLAELYDLLLSRAVPSVERLRRYQRRMNETGVLAYGQIYKPQSTYHALTFALAPFLRSAFRNSRNVKEN